MKKKRLLIFVSIGLLFSFVPISVLSMWTPPAIGGAGGDDAIKNLMEKVFTPLWQLFAGLAVIMFVIAGVLFLTSAGDPGKIATAKQAVIWGIVGIVVAIIAFSIVTIITGWFG